MSCTLIKLDGGKTVFIKICGKPEQKGKVAYVPWNLFTTSMVTDLISRDVLQIANGTYPGWTATEVMESVQQALENSADPPPYKPEKTDTPVVVKKKRGLWQRLTCRTIAKD